MDIAFHFQKKITLTDRTKLKQFIRQIFNNEKTPALSLNVIFCDDEYLLGINKSFLQHDYYTDIITFDLSNSKNSVDGELYLSVDRIRDNAKAQHVSVQNELHRVIFHGILHLCGYKDKTKAQIKKIRNAEDKYIGQFFKCIVPRIPVSR